MSFIRINIGFVVDPGDPEPPKELVDLVAGRMRAWLSGEGLEGELDVIERDGVKVPSLKVMKPDVWGKPQMQAFAAKAGDKLKDILSDLTDPSVGENS
jgi:hypothetical protein